MSGIAIFVSDVGGGLHDIWNPLIRVTDDFPDRTIAWLLQAFGPVIGAVSETKYRVSYCKSEVSGQLTESL